MVVPAVVVSDLSVLRKNFDELTLETRGETNRRYSAKLGEASPLQVLIELAIRHHAKASVAVTQHIGKVGRSRQITPSRLPIEAKNVF